MDILRDFQVSFFAMSRLVSFPWAVSKTGAGRVLGAFEQALNQPPYYVLICSFCLKSVREIALSGTCDRPAGRR